MATRAARPRVFLARGDKSVNESVGPAPASRHGGRLMRLLQSLNKVVLLASLGLALVAFWNRNDLPARSTLRAQLEDEPRQKQISKDSFAVDYAGVRYKVEPLYEYELEGMVVSFRQHDGKSEMHSQTNDHLNVADLCVVWGQTAASPYLSDISFWNGIFTCNFQTRSQTAWESIRPQQISNNHLITNDDFLRRQIGKVTIGDQIRVRGWLSAYGTGGNRRGTSITREDTGDGACETIFVNDFQITRRARNPWRTALYSSLAVLALSLVVYFRMPYRPYA
jgi:hypothetical protein